MYELFGIVAGGEYTPIAKGSYAKIEWLHLWLWNWLRISTFIKEV